jgi:broad specificity phosphatase PhoE
MRTFTEIEAESPDHIRAFWETPGEISPPGGESWNAICGRIERAVQRLTHLPEVIVVAHFGAIVAAIQHAGGLTATQAFGHKIDNLSVTCLEFGAAPRVLSINHIP